MRQFCKKIIEVVEAVVFDPPSNHERVPEGVCSDYDPQIVNNTSIIAGVLWFLMILGANENMFCAAHQLKTWCDFLIREIDLLKLTNEKDVLKWDEHPLKGAQYFKSRQNTITKRASVASTMVICKQNIYTMCLLGTVQFTSD